MTKSETDITDENRFRFGNSYFGNLLLFRI